MSNESKKAKKIVDWNFNATEYSTDGRKISIKGNIRYDDGSVEPKNIEISPSEHSNLAQGGKISVSDIISNLDHEMKEKVKQQEGQKNKD